MRIRMSDKYSAEALLIGRMASGEDAYKMLETDGKHITGDFSVMKRCMECFDREESFTAYALMSGLKAIVDVDFENKTMSINPCGKGNYGSLFESLFS